MTRGAHNRGCVAAAALALVLASTHAGAQSREANEARVAFERGVAAVAAGRYDEAVTALRRSLTLRPVPIVRYNLGLAYRGLNRHVDAIREFTHYLREHEPDAEYDRLSALQAEITRLRQSVGVIDIGVNPGEVTVRVDGELREFDAGDAAVMVEPGAHRVEVRARGYLPGRDTIVVGPGERVTFRMTLASEGAPAPAPGPTPPPAGRVISPLVWIGGSVALASAASMIAVQVSGEPLHARFRMNLCDDPAEATVERCGGDFDELAARNTALAVLAGVTAAGAAVAVIGAVVTLATPRADRRARRVQARPLIGLGQLGVHVAW